MKAGGLLDRRRRLPGRLCVYIVLLLLGFRCGGSAGGESI